MIICSGNSIKVLVILVVDYLHDLFVVLLLQRVSNPRRQLLQQLLLPLLFLLLQLPLLPQLVQGHVLLLEGLVLDVLRRLGRPQRVYQGHGRVGVVVQDQVSVAPFLAHGRQFFLHLQRLQFRHW